MSPSQHRRFIPWGSLPEVATETRGLRSRSPAPMLWAAALVACVVTHLALAAPANVTATAAAPASAPQPLLAGDGAAVPAAGPAAARAAPQTVNASGVPYTLSAPAQGPAPGSSDPASYARRRTVNVSNGTHILYNVSVVTADGSPAPLAATPFAPDQTLYTVSATPPPTAPASNTPLITWVTIAGALQKSGLAFEGSRQRPLATRLSSYAITQRAAIARPHHGKCRRPTRLSFDGCDAPH